MNVKRVEPQDCLIWEERYMAALFELDKSKLDGRISEAEAAIVQRIREFFQAGGDSMPTQLRERQALDAALDALRALRTVSFTLIATPSPR
jgi:hypothetical protein